MIERGDWQVSEIARNAFDLEGKVVGTIGAGRIGYRVLQRLAPFDCKELLYYDYSPLPAGNYSTFTTALRFCLIMYYPTAAAASVKARRVEDLKVSSNLIAIRVTYLINCRNLSLRFVRGLGDVGR